MATHPGSILVVKKGHVPPKDVLSKLLTGVNVIGGAWVIKNTLSVFKWPNDKRKDVPTLDQLMEGMQKFKDLTRMFYLGKYPEGYQPDDIQPFEVLSSNGRPSLVACLDGDFSKYAQPKSKHSNAFFALQSKIGPNVRQINDLVGGDTSKVLAAIQNPIQTANYLESGERGVVCFLSISGEVIPLEMANGKNAIEAEWGYCSNNFASAAIEEETEEQDEDNLPWESTDGKASEGDEEQDETDDNEAKEAAQSAKSDADKEAANINALMAMYELNPKQSTVRPTAEIKTLNGLRRWYRRNFGGWCPNDQEIVKRPWVETTRLDIKDSPVFKDLVLLNSKKEISVRLPNIKDSTNIPKDILSAPAPTTQTRAEKKAEQRQTKDQPVAKGAADVPIIGAAAKESIQKTFLTKDFRDRTAQTIKDPKKLAEDEKRFGTFTSQLGLKGLEETFGWVFEDWCDLAAVDMKAVCVALVQYQNALRSTLAEKEGVDEDQLVSAFGG